MMVTIAPSKGSSESSENHDQDVQVEEDDETVEPTQAPPILEEGGQVAQDDLLEINLGTDEEPRPKFISGSMSPKERSMYLELLKQNRDVFAWTYSEMSRLDPAVAMHRLAIEPEKRPVKQAPRRMHPDLAAKVEAEVDRLIMAKFIWEVQYQVWLANIVPVKKKNVQIRVCIDFRDLNKACQKTIFQSLI